MSANTNRPESNETNDSPRCCIDEASSGIDPIARRKIREILLAERGQRTLLLSTHFLDEAQVLSDHVAILSKGILKAEGSVATLKNRLGEGYRVVMRDSPAISDLPLVPGAQRYQDYDHAVFRILDSTSLATFIALLERHGLSKYSIHGPTIEEVFLKLAEEMQGESGLARDLKLADADLGRSDSEETVDPSTKRQGLMLNTGKGCTAMKQTWILFRKRITVLRHNYMPYVGALFVALVVAGMVTRFLNSYFYTDGIPCDDPSLASTGSFVQPLDSSNLLYGYFVYGPPSRLPVKDL